MEPHAGQPVVTAGASLSEAGAVMIMVHGRNAGPRNILELVPFVDPDGPDRPARPPARPGFAYLAPGAANNTWYPYSFMADTARNEPGLSSGLQVIRDLVADVVTRGIPKERIVLLGFSQGACLTSEFAVRHAGRYGGIIVFSGGLIGPPGTTWSHPGSFDGTPVFLGCSDVDAHVPKTRVDESAEVFRRMGAVVTERIYPAMGHLVNDDEMLFARTLMNHVLA